MSMNAACPLCNGSGELYSNHPILKNTVANAQAISLLATIVALEAMGAEYEIVKDCIDEKGAINLIVSWDREAYSDMGYHVGTEYYKATAPVFDSTLLGGVLRIPPKFDHHIIFFESFDIEIVAIPEENEGDPLETDEENKSISDSYCPPDDDFAYQEFQNLMRDFWNQLPVAEFNEETRTWAIGDREWTVSRYQFEYF